MLEFPLIHDANNVNKYSRILFNSEAKLRLRVLYDSGATVPVWTCDSSFLLYAYPDAELLHYKIPLMGFGEGIEYCPVYKIPCFTLNDGTNKLVFNNLPIAVHSKTRPFHMIASFTMFNRLNHYYDISQGRPRFIVNTVRTQMFADYILGFDKNTNADVIVSVNVLTQDNIDLYEDRTNVFL